MAALLAPADVAELLGVRDLRTVRLRLIEMSCPMIPFGRSYRVQPADLERALADAAIVYGPPAPPAPRRRHAPARSGPYRMGDWRRGMPDA